jgi:putative ABC transport system permease protein
MWQLAMASIRTRWRAYIGVFLTVATAVSLMSATGLLLESGIRGNIAPERLAGAPVVVAGDQSVQEHRGSGDGAETVMAGVQERVRIDESLADTVRSVHGVSSVHTDVSFPAYLLGEAATPVSGPDGGASLGHAWGNAASFRLVVGRAPADADEIVVDRGMSRRADVSVGDSVTVVAAGQPGEREVVGLVVPKNVPLTQQSAVFFTPDEATRLYGHPGHVDALLVQVPGGTSSAETPAVAQRVQAAIGTRANVYTGDGRGPIEFLEGVDAGIRLIAISGSLAGIGLAVTVFVVAGMLALVVHQRHREIALLRAIAATPRQVRRLVALETFLVTLPAALVGVWPGQQLAAALAAALKGHDVLPGTFRMQAGPMPVIVAVAAVLLVVQAAAFVAGRRAAKVRPTEALATAALQPGRIGPVRALVGLVALGGTAALFLVSLELSASVAPAVAPAMVVLLMMDVVLFAPLLASVGVRLLSLPIRWFGVGGYLADLNTRGYARRLASAMTPIVLAVGIAGMTVFQQTTLTAETSAQGRERTVADRVVTGGEPGLPVAAVRELSGSAGVRTAVGLLPTTLHANYELDPYAVQAVTGGPIGDVLDLDIEHGSVAALRRGEVALSSELASTLRADVGDPVKLRLGDGTPVEPTVVATYARSRGFGDAVLPLQTVREHVTDAVLSTVLLRSDAGPAELDRSLSEFEREHPTARVGDATVLRQAEDANAQTQAWVSYVLMGLVILFVSLAVINTLVLATADRAREFALMRLVGTTKRQVVRMVRWEALIVVALGTTVGVAVAAATLIPFSQATTGSPEPSTPLLHVAVILGLVLVVGLSAMLIPARLAMRSRPVDTIGMRE